MPEYKCLPVNYTKVIIRGFLDFFVIAVLLFLIAFMESFIRDLGNSISYIFQEKLLLFVVMMALSLVLSVLVSFIEINARCVSLKCSDDSIIFIKRNKQESVKLAYDLFVRMENKKDAAVFSFRQNKRVNNAYLSLADGASLYEFLRQKEINVKLSNSPQNPPNPPKIDENDAKK